MSRIGKKPVLLGSVQASIQDADGDRVLTIKGGKHVQSIKIPTAIDADISDKKLLFTRKNDQKATKALHGLIRSLANNAVVGVMEGWKKSLELKGVGYRATLKGKTLELSIGFSNPVKLELPKDVEVVVEKQTTLHIKGPDRSVVGEFSSKIRSLRPPEPYLGKGVKYKDEIIVRKAGKSGAKK